VAALLLWQSLRVKRARQSDGQRQSRASLHYGKSKSDVMNYCNAVASLLL